LLKRSDYWSSWRGGSRRSYRCSSRLKDSSWDTTKWWQWKWWRSSNGWNRYSRMCMGRTRR